MIRKVLRLVHGDVKAAAFTAAELSQVGGNGANQHSEKSNHDNGKGSSYGNNADYLAARRCAPTTLDHLRTRGATRHGVL